MMIIKLIIFLFIFYSQFSFAQCKLMPDEYHENSISTMDLGVEKYNFIQDTIDEIFLEKVQIQYEKNVTSQLTKAYQNLAKEYNENGRKNLTEIEINDYLKKEFITYNRLENLETYYSHDPELHGKLIGDLTYERYVSLPEGEFGVPWLPFVFDLPKGSVAYVCAELNKRNANKNHISILFLELQEFEKLKWWQIISKTKRIFTDKKAVVSASHFQFRSRATTQSINDFFKNIPVLNLVAKILDRLAYEIDKPLQEILVNAFSGGIKAITITPRGMFISHNAKVLFINFHLGTYQYTDEEFAWLSLLSLP